MRDLFYEIVKLSITGSYIFLFVITIRMLIKKAPRKYSYYLWFIFWLRLMIPNSIKSVFSVFNYTTVTPQKSVSTLENIVYPSLIDINGNGNTANIAEAQNTAVQTVGSANVLETVLWSAWVLGIAFILIYSLIAYTKLKRNVGNSYLYKDNIYLSKNVDSPFVIGLFRPRIYMPYNLEGAEFKYILMHEQIHIKRYDHIIKILCYLVLALHWFNPLAWIAFILMGKDIEISCDEKVLERLGTSIKKDYSYSLLNMSLKDELTPMPIGFSQCSAKERIKRVMNYKKTQPIIVVIIVIILFASGCALLSNPVDTEQNQPTAVPDAHSPVNTPIVVSEQKGLYDGLSGVELYNAVMTGNYSEKIMYTTEASNEDEDVIITVYRYQGNFKEITVNPEYETMMIYYVDDELTAYLHYQNSKTGQLYKYEKSEDANYNGITPTLRDEDHDKLVESKIIDYNGRETYYYEMHYEFDGGDYKDVYVNKYWVDTETKVQMHGEFYMNDFLIANSSVTEMTDDFEVTDDFFTPPADVEFVDVEDRG